ncbi:MAG: hypothetical protein LC798_12980 [Chloroflexi bacterium]|nr:hypothetical protein [Chloroflexota bacterium]
MSAIYECSECGNKVIEPILMLAGNVGAVAVRLYPYCVAHPDREMQRVEDDPEPTARSVCDLRIEGGDLRDQPFAILAAMHTRVERRQRCDPEGVAGDAGVPLALTVEWLQALYDEKLVVPDVDETGDWYITSKGRREVAGD